MTNIEWTEKTWNPIVGCSVVSPGCTNCYAMKMAHRLASMAVKPDGAGNIYTTHYEGLTKDQGRHRHNPVWTGKVARAGDDHWHIPLKRKKPTMFFVCSMGDLFHKNVPDQWIDEVFAIMAFCPQHVFQVLTKRPQRMRDYILSLDLRAPWPARLPDETTRLISEQLAVAPQLPLPNVWLGVSTEDQRRADERIPHLLETPAAIRFISAEPLLGTLDLNWVGTGEYGVDALSGTQYHEPPENMSAATSQGNKLDWVIVGGESGPNARPMHPEWVRTIRDDCGVYGVPFFFKQWGKWGWVGSGSSGVYDPGQLGAFVPSPQSDNQLLAVSATNVTQDATIYAGTFWAKHDAIHALGKKRAGRRLDGLEHDEMPSPREASS